MMFARLTIVERARNQCAYYLNKSDKNNINFVQTNVFLVISFDFYRFSNAYFFKRRFYLCKYVATCDKKNIAAFYPLQNITIRFLSVFVFFPTLGHIIKE